jgi:uncharacterized protein CbrC (UPF0167 family)
MLQDPNVERYVASATKPLKKEIDKLRTELEELKQAFALYNVSQRSELLVCKECNGRIDELDVWCKHCGEVIY